VSRSISQPLHGDLGEYFDCQNENMITFLGYWNQQVIDYFRRKFALERFRLCFGFG